ncbi:MAG: SH3 domain-containing protein [Lachnospiraceae bacterium]
MDNFREWLSDNLRYIILILGIIAVLVIAFFGIRFISSKISDNSDESTPSAEASVEEESSAVDSNAQTSEDSSADVQELQLNFVPEVTNLISDYYNAISNKDVTTLNGLLDILSDEDSAQIITDEQVLFSDVQVYTLPGFVDDSYIVFARYNYKTANADMTLPGLAQLYVIKNASGNYVIKTQELSEGETVYVNKALQSPAVQELINEVNSDYDSAYAKAQELEKAEEIASQTVVENESEPEESSAEEPAESTASSGEYDAVIKSSCNIRSGPSNSNDIIGEVSSGSTVTIIGKDGNWYNIRYGELTGYISDKFV